MNVSGSAEPNKLRTNRREGNFNTKSRSSWNGETNILKSDEPTQSSTSLSNYCGRKSKEEANKCIEFEKRQLQVY